MADKHRPPLPGHLLGWQSQSPSTHEYEAAKKAARNLPAEQRMALLVDAFDRLTDPMLRLVATLEQAERRMRVLVYALSVLVLILGVADLVLFFGVRDNLVASQQASSKIDRLDSKLDRALDDVAATLKAVRATTVTVAAQAEGAGDHEVRDLAVDAQQKAIEAEARVAPSPSVSRDLLKVQQKAESIRKEPLQVRDAGRDSGLDGSAPTPVTP